MIFAILLIIFGLILAPHLRYVNFREKLKNGNPVYIRFRNETVHGHYREYIDGMCLVKIDYFGTIIDIVVEKENILPDHRFNYNKQKRIEL